MAVEGGGGAVDFLFMKITGQILSLMQGRSPTKSNARARTYDRPEVIDKSKLGYLSGFVFAITVISLTYDRSFAFDRPIQSSVLALLVAGLAILLLHFTFPRLLSPAVRSEESWALPLEDRSYPHGSRETSPNYTPGAEIVSLRKQRLLFIATVSAVCLRVGVFWQISRNRQCTSTGVEGYVSTLLAFYECWPTRQKQYGDVNLAPHDARTTVLGRMTHTYMRSIVPAALMACASILGARVSSYPRSTYICPVALSLGTYVPILQFIGVFLDCCIMTGTVQLMHSRRNDARANAGRSSLVVSSVLLSSATVLAISGFAVVYIIPEQRSLIIGVDAVYLKSLTWMTALITLMIICTIPILIDGSTLDLAMLVSFVCTYVIGVSTSWVNRSSFPPSLGGSTVISLILLFLGAGTYLYFGALTDRPRTQTQRRFFARMPSSLYTLLTFLLVLRIILEFSRSSDLNYHPIDFLIREADQQHNTWLRQASASRTLRQATDEYRRRYDRHPPPGFDKWYDYATTRSSLIIDDYDSIFENLLPFWALEPQHLRARTREILLDPWNEVAEVSIRSGKAEIGPSVLPTHRWMVEGVLEMLGNFAEWLPDMDLAFNINDESRVAVPYHTLENYRKIGMRAGRLEVGKSPEWSSNRADTWRPIDETAIPPSRFEDHSFVNNFYSYSSIACPPSSPARRTRIWDPRILCTSCFSPHSIGPFLSNWTLSASPCHQPDLANLHGFYLSPAAFKTAHELLPVFSQSKPHGYADILYPSPWNYMDKVKYDPSPPSDDPNDQGPYPDLPFAEKENTLFWRGATSEGVSVLGTWKGMTRQRLIHLSTPNLTSSSSSSSFSQPPILLPHPTHPQKYTYQPLSPFTSLLNFTPSLSLVSHISRCGGPDCPDQATEFAPLLPPSDFQAHWRHKFLVDVDGAGFSGRFLPFLQSGCLPFKAALFREWWDGRVTAWRHFVPLDLRLQGVWSTVAYFVGVGGGGGAEGGAGAGEGAGGSGGAHIKEAETIAEAGRAWAAKVLRKEDMEVYFFRLLLEWGRLTDDRRDEIGF